MELLINESRFCATAFCTKSTVTASFLFHSFRLAELHLCDLSPQLLSFFFFISHSHIVLLSSSAYRRATTQISAAAPAVCLQPDYKMDGSVPLTIPNNPSLFLSLELVLFFIVLFCNPFLILTAPPSSVISLEHLFSNKCQQTTTVGFWM